MHDGVALYYSHPSIQLGWILDAQAHGKTWVNRDGDHRLGASHLVRQAWENMLRDSGLQYKLPQLRGRRSRRHSGRVQNPDPARLPVPVRCRGAGDRSVLPTGGTVIADYLPGVWDQHGRGRKAGGALDALFGVRHDPAMTAADVFGGKLWCEVDQDANFGWKTYAEFLTNGNTCLKDPSGFHKAVRDMPVATRQPCRAAGPPS